ncbi:NAD(P)-binding protein [Piromyces finnis]|uniref:NAD(P)-binding protein n=1 Tax=Piromyces finnis TaxID=1754191 RepID=A0A1Y1VAC4_9FUNG|nr:NAD(P)-binding protein [Piromyces finnis]|eukprot:ORX50336.1 NAD(P)-binding protein [Piromyces finnis]
MPSEPIYVITGASKGIGLETLKYLVEVPGYIISVSRTIPEELSKILNANTSKIAHFCGKVEDPEISKMVIRTIEEKGGKLNALILNVGIAPIAPIDKIDADVWRAVFDINFFSMVDLAQRAIPYLKKAKGRVIMLSSGAAVNAKNGWSIYCCTKACVNMFAKVLSLEQSDIKTIALRPGVVNTGMQEEIRKQMKNGFTKEDIEKFKNYEKNKELKDPKEPASVIFNLAIPENEFPMELNGEFVSIDDEKLAKFKTFKPE